SFRIACQHEGDKIGLACRGRERLAYSAQARRAVQVEASLALGRRPVNANEIDLGARYDPTLDLLAADVQRQPVANSRPLRETALDQEVPSFLWRRRTLEQEGGSG